MKYNNLVHNNVIYKMKNLKKKLEEAKTNY